MSLGDLIARYLVISGGFGAPAALTAFGLTPQETEALFSGYDQDYHISRFLHFSCADGPRFVIDGEPATHVTIDDEMQSIL